MTDRSSRKIILYGAVAHPPSSTPGALDRLKYELRANLDACAHQLQWRSRIDYRNYERQWVFNRGDIAIADSVEHAISTSTPGCSVVRVNWGDLGKANVRSHDLVIIAGSGYVHPSKTGTLPDRMRHDLKVLKDAGCEYVLLGIGVNVLLEWNRERATDLTPDATDLLIEILQRAKLISTRDDQSREFLKKFTPRPINLIGDPALFLPIDGSGAINRRTEKSPLIGLSIPFHGIEPTEWVKHDLDEFISLLREIQQSFNATYRYFIHYDSELLVTKILRANGIKIEICDGNTKELIRGYQGLTMHIGGMLHSCILCTAARTPSIALAYDAKHFGFFELMERQQYCLNGKAIDYPRLRAMTEQLLRSSDLEQKSIDQRIRYLSPIFSKAIEDSLTPINSVD